MNDELLPQLEAALARHARLAIAVSGGVDSMALSHVAHRTNPDGVAIYHAVSPAVPAAATKRVVAHAQRAGWRLELIDAGEMNDPRYVGNPVDRCYFCKSNLYSRIRSRTDATIASGANCDDLSDYRPGLLAAGQNGVVHPLIDAGFGKIHIRALARHLGLDDVSELPAQPCLASRIETGLPVREVDLAFVNQVETLLDDMLGAGDHRCRIVRNGVRIEIDGAQLERLDEAGRHRIGALCMAAGYAPPDFAAYRRGSAFLRSEP
jgi:pyridinium-3,5-biscarboxylic acid mononucleotide sulfurtransferase